MTRISKISLTDEQLSLINGGTSVNCRSDDGIMIIIVPPGTINDAEDIIWNAGKNTPGGNDDIFNPTK